jgi:hypothetical protein
LCDCPNDTCVDSTEENYSDDGESYCRKDICFHNDDDFK